MFRSLIVIGFISFQFIAMRAQTPYKYWNDGHLTWNDFKESNAAMSESSRLVFQIGSVIDREINSDTTIISLKTAAIADKDKSWVKSSQQNKWVLAYNQVIFDIAELYSRQLQIQFDEITSQKQVRNMLVNT